MSDLAGIRTDWRRLNWRMLLIHPVQEGIRFLPALAGVFVLGRTRGGGGGWWELAALVVVVAVGVLRYLTTRFRIDNGQIELRKGLLFKQVIATPADRIRTVDVTAPVFHRLLGLARVEIGTAGAGSERLVLDALTVSQARHLREELIHRRRADPAAILPAASEPAATVPAASEPADGTPAVSGARFATETTLLTLDPSWARYAPLTMTGLVSAVAALGFSSQFFQQALQQPTVGAVVTRLGSYTWWADLLVGLVLLAAVVSVLAVAGYALQFWRFRLSRHTGGTLHVRRGLLTTRETSIEEKRLRGLEIGEPLGLRLAGGSRLHAVTTGLNKKEQDHGSAWLVPPAPAQVVAQVAVAILGDQEALTATLRPHGPAARRRRYVRALAPAVLLAVVALAGALLLGWPAWVPVLALVPVVAAPLVARDRYAGLGHHLSAAHVVVRSGSFSRRRDVLQRSGVIGWTLHRSFFQRRAAIATLVATTAAGRQAYTAYDLPVAEAVALAHEVDPALVGQFLATGASAGPP